MLLWIAVPVGLAVVAGAVRLVALAVRVPAVVRTGSTIVLFAAAGVGAIVVALVTLGLLLRILVAGVFFSRPFPF